MFFLQPTFVWALAGLLLMGSEMFMPDFVIFFFGLGALATAFFSALIPALNASLPAQGILFALSSVATLILLRRKFKKIFQGSILNPGAPQVVGKTGEVIKRITADTPGRVRYNGTSWKAVSYDETLEVGQTVEILEEDGLTLVVSPPLLEDNETRSET